MKISGFENACRISDFKLHSILGGHTECCFHAIFSGIDAGNILSMAKERRNVNVMLNDNTVIMMGFVLSAEGEVTEDYANLWIVISSSSRWCEESFPEKRRIFQNTTKTAKDIVDYINNHNQHKKCNFTIGAGLTQMQKTLSEIWVQDNNINDFVYIRNLAAKNGYMLLNQYSDDSLRIIEPGKNKESLSSNENYSDSVLKLQGTFKYEGSIVTFASLKKLMLGSSIRLEKVPSCYSGMQLILTELTAEERGEYLYYRYTAMEKIHFQSYYIDLPELLCETVKVSDTADPDKKGRICAEFENCEDISESGKQYWISYLSPYVGEKHNGMIMIPDKEDHVQVVIVRGACFSIGSERIKAIQSDYDDPSKRYMVYGSDIYTEWSDKQIVIRNGKDTDSVWKSDEITLEQGERKATLNNKTINLENGSSVKAVYSSNTVEQTAGSTKFKMDNEILLKNGASYTKIESGSVTINSFKIDLKS